MNIVSLSDIYAMKYMFDKEENFILCRPVPTRERGFVQDEKDLQFYTSFYPKPSTILWLYTVHSSLSLNIDK